MHLNTVSWRKALAAVAATLIGALGVMVVVRADGLPAVDAASARATAWFVHQPTGRVVLVDGYGGRALASLDVGAQGEQIGVAEGGAGAYVLNDTTGEARAIDSAELRLGTPLGLTTLGDGEAISSVGQAGLVVVNPVEDEATVVPAGAEPVGFGVATGSATVIAPDGAVWSLVDGDLRRTTSSTTTTTDLGVDDAALSLVGNQPFVVDRAGGRARLGTGGWQDLPADSDPSELIVQQPGPANECGWVGTNDELWCVSTSGVAESATVDGLDIDGSDLLAIAGDAAVLVRRGPTSIVRFDWRTEEILSDDTATVQSDASLSLTASVDLIWIDDTAGDFVWAANPWSLQAVDKNATGILVLGDDGEIVDEGESGPGVSVGADNSAASEPEEREPDDNGIDDPPVAVDDAVTARTGAPVQIQVTGNDYDPDGEAIAVSAVGVAGHGTVDIGTASTVVYTPEVGYVGPDQFDYTIVDGNGTEARADVVLELLATDATNKPPVGVVDEIQTGAGVPVIVEVLLNDVDPERDSLRIGGFSPPESVGQASLGTVSETVGPSGLPALRFEPLEGFEGTALFSYRPIDSLDAVGEDVEVRVEVARVGDENRAPRTRPDAIRLRRNVESPLPVLVNDRDPDGDPLTLSIVEPLPAGLEVDVEGEQLAITARAGASDLVPFEYEVDDGHEHAARGRVLVDVIDDVEPNRPPVIVADTEKAVVGSSVIVEVTANDSDPDGDPLTVVDVSQPADDRGQAVVFSRSQIQFSPAPLADDAEEVNARFSYTVTDGNGHDVAGEVTITVLPEALAEPPYARDDSTFTFVDVPVTVDVLRNDGDPSGGRPSLVGTPGCPSGGRAVVTADSQVRYDPPRGQSGAFRCNYEVTNAQGLRASASIIVSVRDPLLTNEPPETYIDYLTVEVGETRGIDVTANDRDPDGDAGELEVVSSTAPSIGTAQRRGNTIQFTAGGALGTATINYQVSDAEGAVSLGQLVVRVIEKANVPPIAVGDTQTIFGPGTPQQFAVLSNDSDPDDTEGGLSVVSATRTGGDGTVALNGSTVTVTPNPAFVGNVTATYTIRDGGGLTSSANIVLTVNEPLNRPPDARDDATEVSNGGTVTTSVLFNDVDPDGDQLTVSLTGGPDSSLGSASLSGGSVTFVANPGASGTAIINYQVSDGELTDNAVLRITVRPCSASVPVAGEGFLQTGYQQPIAIDLNAYASNGNIVDVTTPAGFSGGVYTPPAGENGNVSITFAVVNTCRQRATGRVTIDVNQDPVVSSKAVNMFRGETREIPVSDLATDTEALTISGSPGAPAWVTTEAGRLVIAPPTGIAPQTYSWTTTVRDPGGLTGAVPISVTIGNRPPTAVADSVNASDGKKITVDLVANDTDGDGPNGDLRIQSVPSSLNFQVGSGTISLQNDNRRVTIDPGTGFGTGTFSYTIVDGNGAVSAAATVTVTAPRINNAPYANNQEIAATVDVPRQFTLDAGDADGDPVTVRDVDDSGNVIVSRDGLNVTVRSSTAGTYTFTYRVEDARDTSRTATVKVVVSAPPPTTTIPPTTTTTPPTTAPPITAAPTTTAPTTTVP